MPKKSPYKWYFKQQESVIIKYMRKLWKSAPINQMPSSSISRICRKTCSCLEFYAWTYCNFLAFELWKTVSCVYVHEIMIFLSSLFNYVVFGGVYPAWVLTDYYFRLLWKINLQRWLWQCQNTIWVRILDNEIFYLSYENNIYCIICSIYIQF